LWPASSQSNRVGGASRSIPITAIAGNRTAGVFRSRYSIRLRRFVHERHEAICGYLRGTRTPQRYATSDV
jgi:hypothetical protein